MTPRQQRFAMLYVMGGPEIAGNGTQAAIHAGFSKAHAKQQASRLLTYGDVKKEIARLQAKEAARAEVTIDTLRSDFERIYDGALAVGQYAAAVSAKQSIAKLYGLLNDRVFVHEREKLSDDELVARIGGDDPTKRLAVRRLISSPSTFATATQDSLADAARETGQVIDVEEKQ